MAGFKIDFQKIAAEARALDVNNLGVWPLWARATASALALVAALAGGYFGKVTAMQEELAALQATEQTLRQEFETKQKKVAALDALKEQLAEMEKSFGAMLRQLPSKAEIANLLNDISQTRVASSLEEELFEPRPEVGREFYAEVPNKIVITGTFHNMGVFVSGVAALPRIVTVDNVTIKASATVGAPKGSLRMEAQANTYRYLDDTEIAATAPKTPGAPNATAAPGAK